MRWVQKSGVKHFRPSFSTEFFEWNIQSKKSSFSTGFPSPKTQSKKVQSKKLTNPTGHFLHSRIPPVENGPFRLDSSGPSYRQSSRSYSFCALPRGCWCEGVLPYCCMAVENRLAALRSARSTRATGASRATNPRPSGLVALAESRQSYVCGVALSRETPKLHQA